MAMTAEDLRKLMPQVPQPTQEAIHIAFDDLPFVEIAPGAEVQLVHVDLKQGLWIARNRFQPGSAITKHYHTGPVYAVTLRGKWYYAEYPDEVNTAGSYLFEPAGSVHTLTIPADQDEPTEVWFAINGCNVEMDENDNVLMVVDASTMLNGYRMICDAQGLDYSKLVVVGE